MATKKLGSVKAVTPVLCTSADLTADVTGVLPVANGGTGTGTFTNGQLLIGNTTGNTLAKGTLTGTANQVVVTNGGGSITLSTPQDIGTGSSPTFAGLTLSAALPIASGGTAQTTALAARGSAGLNVERGTGRGDADYTILATDRFVYTNAAFTAARTFTLPAANAVNAGGIITVADLQGTLTATNTLTVAKAGSDTVNGSGGIALTGAYSTAVLVSDGTSKWSATLVNSATQADQESAANTFLFVSPGRQQYHPSACKAFVYFTVSGTTVSVQRSYNVTSVTRVSSGVYEVAFTTSFSDANFIVAGMVGVNVANTQPLYMRDSSTRATGTFRFVVLQIASPTTNDDPARCSLAFFGDQ